MKMLLYRRRMDALIRRGRIWAAVLKGAALVVLPLPLLLASIAALAGGDLGRLGLAGGSLACLWGAGLLTGRALVAEARYVLGERLDPPAVPLKLVGAVLTAVGAALAATAAGHALAVALVFATLGALGHGAFYGRDRLPRRLSVTVMPGIDHGAVMRQLKQAHRRLRAIDAAARQPGMSEFVEPLRRITRIGRNILDEIERDPRDAVRARRFLNVYLDSAERVTLEYARTRREARSPVLAEHLRRLLVDMERTFAEQHRQLLENDMLTLDVEIEVLHERIRREKVS